MTLTIRYKPKNSRHSSCDAGCDVLSPLFAAIICRVDCDRTMTISHHIVDINSSVWTLTVVDRSLAVNNHQPSPIAIRRLNQIDARVFIHAQLAVWHHIDL